MHNDNELYTIYRLIETVWQNRTSLFTWHETMSQKELMEHAAQRHPSSEVCERTAESTDDHTMIPLPSYLSTAHQTIGALHCDAINYIYGSCDINPAYTDDATAYLKTRRLSLLFTTLSLLSRPKLPGDLMICTRSKIEWSLERLLARVSNDFSLRSSMLDEQPEKMAKEGKVRKEPHGMRRTRLKMQKGLNQRPQETLRMRVVRRRFQNAVDSDDRLYSKARAFGRSSRGESKVRKPRSNGNITGNEIIMLCDMIYLKPESEEEATSMTQDIISGLAERQEITHGRGEYSDPSKLGRLYVSYHAQKRGSGVLLCFRRGQ